MNFPQGLIAREKRSDRAMIQQNTSQHWGSNESKHKSLSFKSNESNESNHDHMNQMSQILTSELAKRWCRQLAMGPVSPVAISYRRRSLRAPAREKDRTWHRDSAASPRTKTMRHLAMRPASTVRQVPWLTLEGEQPFTLLLFSGDFPLNHKNQKCITFPSNNHVSGEMVKTHLRLETSANQNRMSAAVPMGMATAP